MPWHGQNSVSVAGIQNNMIQSLDQVEIPEELSGKLRGVIHDCRLEDPEARPTADRLVLDYFSGKAIILLIFIISTNEIPDELSRENLISSHVKITCYLHTLKYFCCYGYIINRAFHTKKLLKWNGLVFHWCLYNKRNITWPLGDTKFLFSCWKSILLICCAHSRNNFQHSERNFISPHGDVISSIYLTVMLLKDNDLDHRCDP